MSANGSESGSAHDAAARIDDLTADRAAAVNGDESPRRRVELDPDTVERDLARLVLTVVELLRQLMERQALRRVDTGELTEDQEERIGVTLMLLEDRMDVLRDKFGLEPGDLNIDLGPLGPLLPRGE